VQGFIVNDADVADITTSYAADKAILLHEDSGADPKSRAMPQSCYLSHIEIQLDETGATCANVSLFLTWDDLGDDPMTAEAKTQTVHAGMDNTSLRNLSVAMDVWVTAPTGQSVAGKCYMFLKTNAGTVTAKKVRLHWSDRANR